MNKRYNLYVGIVAIIMGVVCFAIGIAIPDRTGIFWGILTIVIGGINIGSWNDKTN
jgi:uncharacterized membrane protein HdeD (DUF308 family)